MRAKAKDVPFFAAILADVEKPQICGDPQQRAFYGGVLCILNLLEGVDNETDNG